MALRERKKRPQVGWLKSSVAGVKEWFTGSPEESSVRPGFGSNVYYNYYAQPVRTVEETPPVLMRGSTGRWVTYVQQRLGLQPIGVYDGRTEAAVRQVQASAGLAATGVTDVATWAAIARLPQGYGFGQLSAPYGSYDPYAGSFGPTYFGYPYAVWQTFRNPSRGSSSSPSGGGGRSGGM